jgi:AcrR family transcriptional regulator
VIAEDDSPLNEKVGTVRRRGGRSSRVRAAVLAAARERLLARGYSALSVRDVAKVAGVAPTTVYRHWPTVADLASAAMTDLVGSEDIVPDTGSLERDLRALLEKVARMLSQPEIKRILRAVIAIDDTTATASTLRQQLWRNRTEGASIIIDRAVMRSELPAGTDAEALLETMIAPLYLRVLLDIGPLDQAVIDRVIHAALAGR